MVFLQRLAKDRELRVLVTGIVTNHKQKIPSRAYECSLE